MSTGKRIGLVALVLVGGYLGGTAFLGSKVEQAITKQTEDITQYVPFAKVLENKYEKGFFSSTHTAKVQLGCLPLNADNPQERTPIIVAWRDQIHTGPLPAWKTIGAATIESEVIWPESMQATLQEFFGQNISPLKASTRVGWTGGYTTNLVVPPVAKKEQDKELQWSGLTVHIADPKNPAGIAIFDVTMPDFNFKQANQETTATLGLKNLRMHVEQPANLSPDQIWAHAGTVKVELDSGVLDIHPTNPNAVEDEEGAAEEAANNSGQPPKKFTVGWSNVKYVGKTVLDKGALTSTASLAAAAKISDFIIKSAQLETSLKNLNAQAYSALLKKNLAQTFTCDGTKNPSEVLADFTPAFRALLQGNPEYAVDKLVVEMDGKKGEASYAVGIRDVTPADDALPFMMLAKEKAYAKAAIKLPIEWIERVLLLSGAKRDPSITKDTIQQKVNELLAPLAASGYVTVDRKNNFISSDVNYAKGSIQVNGKPFALPGMAAPTGQPDGTGAPEGLEAH